MDQTMFTGVFAAMSIAKKLDVVSNNLANVNTSGFKRSEVTFEDTMLHYAYDEVKEPVAYVQERRLFPEGKNVSRVRIVGDFIQTQQGSLRHTNNPFDVAIQGEGFFKVQHEQGIAYTRAGSFAVSSEGVLVTPDGYPVLGVSGPITIPQNAKYVEIDEEGMVTIDGTQLDQLDVVTIPTDSLQRLGNSLFFAEGAVETPSTAVIAQGRLESSNVNAIQEMVSLIEVNRLFDMYQNIMQTSDSIQNIVTSRIAKAV
ncbi:MAG: flagellar basal-body rod protein FlgF [Desulfovibrionaceae bacterium]|nr:flagellar basal-body rod protein FlgF [Desulfovibrionaceae bacterium]